MKNESVLDGLRNNINNEISTIFRKGYDQGYADGIVQGQVVAESALEFAYKSGREDALKSISSTTEDVLKSISSATESYVAKIESEPEPEKFEIGDEIIDNSGITDKPMIITRIYNDYMDCIDESGEVYEYVDPADVTKTGRCFKVEIYRKN